MTESRFIEIIQIMASRGMIDTSRLLDKNYVIDRVSLYLKTKEIVDNMFKGF